MSVIGLSDKHISTIAYYADLYLGASAKINPKKLAQNMLVLNDSEYALNYPEDKQKTFLQLKYQPVKFANKMAIYKLCDCFLYNIDVNHPSAEYAVKTVKQLQKKLIYLLPEYANAEWSI